MVGIWGQVLLSVGAVSALSLVGALTLTWSRLRSHAVMVGLVAVAAGALLGDAFFHLLPEAIEASGALTPRMAGLVLAGFLVFFLLEAGLRWGHAHGEIEHLPHGDGDGHARIEPFGWLNLVGDGVHNLIDGILIGAAYLADPALGVATTVAVAFHELPQELGDFGVLIRSGMAPARALGFNLLSALLAVVGAVFVLALPVAAENLEALSLPLIAGGFLYIAAADLVPELHHHTGPRYVPLVAIGLVVGLASMYLLLGLEV